MSLPRRRWPIVKNMAQMTVATGTEYLNPRHAVRAIRCSRDVLRSYGLKKTRPASAGIEFCVGSEKRQSAANAGVNAGFLVVQQITAKRPLRAFAAGNLVLRWRELLLPFGVTLGDLARFEWANKLPLAID